MSEQHSAYYLQFVEAIDRCDQDVSLWEARFIESVLRRRPERLTEKQCEVIRRMAQRYLGEDVE